MGKRANYGFEKRQKEIKRQQKKDAKAEKKRMKKESAASGESSDVMEGNGEDLEQTDDLAREPDPATGGTAHG